VQDVVEKAALEKQAQPLKSPRTCVCLVVHELVHFATSVGYLYM
jgi:hypothetical protein